MKQHLLFIGTLLLLPKIITSLIVIRIAFFIKWIKAILCLIAILLAGFCILVYVLCYMIISCFAEEFKNLRTIAKTFLCIIFLWTIFRTVKYFLGLINRKIQLLPQTLVPSLHTVKQSIIRQLKESA